MKRVIGLLAAGVCAMMPAMAQAAPIDFRFTIKVTSTSGTPSNVFGEAVNVDSVFKGYVTWDPAATDKFASDPVFGGYEFDGGLAVIGLLTTTPISSRKFDITVSDGYPPPSSDTLQLTSTTLEGAGAGIIVFGFGTQTGGLWTGDKLPSTGLSAATLAAINTRFAVNNGADGLEAKITSFEVGSWDPDPNPGPTPTVPEPTSLMLLGTGLVGVATRARRLRRA